jgi:geranylgeranyl pyrophosphate synthase
MAEVPFAVDLAPDRGDIDAAIARVCDDLPELPGRLGESVRYTLRGPGKRMRGIMVTASYRAAGGGGNVTELAVAVEMLHAYSLAHDDLPCMDDDDMRRGRPTTHRAYGVPAAVVAGVAIIPLAAGAAARAVNQLHGGAARCGRIVAAMMQAAGGVGMIGGQLQDLIAEDIPATSLDALERIHRAKTGALMAVSCRVGAIAAGASEPAIEALGSFGADIGLAFQIVDDVLDVTSSSTELGKTAGRDAQLGKSTYPGLLGTDGAMDRAVALTRNGCRVLTEHNLLSQELRHLADLVITRTH